MFYVCIFLIFPSFCKGTNSYHLAMTKKEFVTVMICLKRYLSVIIQPFLTFHINFLSWGFITT
jgi:hypothetical protein